jgi:hypothetical protein
MTGPMTNSLISLIALFPVVILAAMLLLPLLWSTHGLLLGVHVSPEFLATPAARRILRNYTAGAVLTGLCGIAAAVIGLATDRPWLWIAAEIIEVIGLLALAVTVLRLLRPHRPASHVRSAFLAQEGSGRGLLLSMLAALLPLVGVAALLVRAGKRFPADFPFTGEWTASPTAGPAALRQVSSDLSSWEPASSCFLR